MSSVTLSCAPTKHRRGQDRDERWPRRRSAVSLAFEALGREDLGDTCRGPAVRVTGANPDRSELVDMPGRTPPAPTGSFVLTPATPNPSPVEMGFFRGVTRKHFGDPHAGG